MPHQRPFALVRLLPHELDHAEPVTEVDKRLAIAVVFHDGAAFFDQRSVPFSGCCAGLGVAHFQQPLGRCIAVQVVDDMLDL